MTTRCPPAARYSCTLRRIRRRPGDLRHQQTDHAQAQQGAHHREHDLAAKSQTHGRMTLLRHANTMFVAHSDNHPGITPSRIGRIHIPRKRWNIAVSDIERHIAHRIMTTRCTLEPRCRNHLFHHVALLLELMFHRTTVLIVTQRFDKSNTPYRTNVCFHGTNHAMIERR